MGLETPQPCNGARLGAPSIFFAEKKETARDDEDDKETATQKTSIKSHFCKISTKNDGFQVDCATANQSYEVAGRSNKEMIVASVTAAYTDSLQEALGRAEFNFVLTDPRIQDNPIVYASDGFLTMTGYTAEEILGRNCRFLQGPATDRRTVIEIRDAIREERPCQVTMLNYDKQGKPFWNLFHMAPVYSKQDGRVVHFVGVQTPIHSNVDQDDPPSSVECYCASAPQKLASLISTTDGPDHTSSRISIDEDCCEVRENDKDKAKICVKTLLNELTSKCKGAGVTETRCINVSLSSCADRVICSSLMISLTKVQQSFVLANPHLPDMPIVHASELFLQLTGFTREEVVGKNCRFLQGPDTDQKAVQMIRECLKGEKSCTVRIRNYRKDKTPFSNILHISPIRSNFGKVVFFVGVQLDASSVEESNCGSQSSPHMKQLGAVGAVRVAVRSLQGDGLRRIRKS